jgi:type VII secretion protein EccB
MQTKKDLYQAHRLMQQRLGMALLQAEPDVPESPMRRQNVATFGGILVGVLVMAVFGIWGLVSPGNATNLTDPGQLLVEEESGAKFIYSAKQGRMFPVANYVSARLVLDAAQITTRNVAAASLAEYARGPLIGIAGAPDSLPAKEKLVKAPWSVCVVDGLDSAGDRKAYTTLVGGVNVGERAVGGDAMVVNDGHQNWVIWADRRMRVSAAEVRAMNAQPRTVPAAWLNSLPVGHDFVAPSVPNRGAKVRANGKVAAVVGRVYTVTATPGEAARWYVLLSDGLAPISALQGRLLLDDVASKKAYGNSPVVPIPIDAASANASPSRQTKIDLSLPATMPKPISPPATTPLCTVYANTQAGSVAARVMIGKGGVITTPASSGNQDRFDQTLLPPGSAVVAGVLPGEGQLGAAAGSLFLISDQGIRYPIPNADVLTKLGYDATDVTPIPAGIMHAIPQGPTLDPTLARAPENVAVQ